MSDRLTVTHVLSCGHEKRAIELAFGVGTHWWCTSCGGQSRPCVEVIREPGR